MNEVESALSHEKGIDNCAVSRRSTMIAGARVGIELPSDFEVRRLDSDGGLGARRGEVKSTATDGKELGEEMLGNR